MTKPINRTNVGPGLKQIIQLRNVSLKSISAKTGISRSTLSRIVNGKSEMRLSTLVDICESLGYEIQVVMKTKEGKV